MALKRVLPAICTTLGDLEVSMSPSDNPMEQDDVVLRCKADNLLYHELAWFRATNLSEVEQAESTLPCRLLTLRPLPQAVLSNVQGNITLELKLPNASREDEGLYVCKVKNIKMAKSTCILRHLSLKGWCGLKQSERRLYRKID